MSESSALGGDQVDNQPESKSTVPSLSLSLEQLNGAFSGAIQSNISLHSAWADQPLFHSQAPIGLDQLSKLTIPNQPLNPVSQPHSGATPKAQGRSFVPPQKKRKTESGDVGQPSYDSIANNSNVLFHKPKSLNLSSSLGEAYVNNNNNISNNTGMGSLADSIPRAGSLANSDDINAWLSAMAPSADGSENTSISSYLLPSSASSSSSSTSTTSSSPYYPESLPLASSSSPSPSSIPLLMHQPLAHQHQHHPLMTAHHMHDQSLIPPSQPHLQQPMLQYPLPSSLTSSPQSKQVPKIPIPQQSRTSSLLIAPQMMTPQFVPQFAHMYHPLNHPYGPQMSPQHFSLTPLAYHPQHAYTNRSVLDSMSHFKGAPDIKKEGIGVHYGLGRSGVSPALPHPISPVMHSVYVPTNSIGHGGAIGVSPGQPSNQQANNQPNPSPTQSQPSPGLLMYQGSPAALPQPAPGGSSLAQLLILEQPVPKCLFINRKLIPPFRVKLVCSNQIDIKEFTLGNVKACLVSDSAETTEITNNTEPLDKDGNAAFGSLKFAMGTHQRLVQLYFETTLTNIRGAEPITATSCYSEPFIVCTNIKQWVKAEGTVLKKVSFGEKTQITWDAFVVALKRQFTLAIASPRGLSPGDLDTIHRKFSNQEIITQNDFNDFWSNWYGPILKTIYQKHGRSLWDKRIIYGFVSAEKIEIVLRELPEGTFVIRFSDGSESGGGQLVISYMNADGTPHHYKLSDKEQKLPIQDFLSSKKTLFYLLQPSPNNNIPGDKKPAIVLKEAILKELRPSRSSAKSKANAQADNDDDDDAPE